jgi:hypothetical protein
MKKQPEDFDRYTEEDERWQTLPPKPASSDHGRSERWLSLLALLAILLAGGYALYSLAARQVSHAETTVSQDVLASHDLIRTAVDRGDPERLNLLLSGRDPAQILSALFSGVLISAPSRAALLTTVDVPANHPFFQQPAYGLGIMVDGRSRYGLMAGHGGGGPGYAAGALHLPDVHGHQLTTVVLANGDDELGLALAFRLAMLVDKVVAEL